jgi:hypothetical protein
MSRNGLSLRLLFKLELEKEKDREDRMREEYILKSFPKTRTIRHLCCYSKREKLISESKR